MTTTKKYDYVFVLHLKDGEPCYKHNIYAQSSILLTILTYKVQYWTVSI